MSRKQEVTELVQCPPPNIPKLQGTLDPGSALLSCALWVFGAQLKSLLPGRRKRCTWGRKVGIGACGTQRVVMSKSVRGQSRKAKRSGVRLRGESIGPGPATTHGVWMDLNWEPGNHRGLGPGAQDSLPAPCIWRWLSLNSQSGLSVGPRQKVAEGQALRLLLTHLCWFIDWELLPWEGLTALRTSLDKSCHLQGQHRCLWDQLGNVRCLLSSLSQAFHEHEHAPACTQCAVGAP